MGGTNVFQVPVLKLKYNNREKKKKGKEVNYLHFKKLKDKMNPMLKINVNPNKAPSDTQ